MVMSTAFVNAVSYLGTMQCANRWPLDFKQAAAKLKPQYRVACPVWKQQREVARISRLLKTLSAHLHNTQILLPQNVATSLNVKQFLFCQLNWVSQKCCVHHTISRAAYCRQAISTCFRFYTVCNASFINLFYVAIWNSKHQCRKESQDVRQTRWPCIFDTVKLNADCVAQKRAENGQMMTFWWNISECEESEWHIPSLTRYVFCPDANTCAKVGSPP